MLDEKEYEHIEQVCEKLRAADRVTKIEAINSMRQVATDKEISSEKVFKIYDGIYLHLMKCYSDRFEAVRSAAICAVNEFLERLPVNEYYLAQVLGVLFERMGKAETIEESEEIRLALIMQLYHIIKYLNILLPGTSSSGEQSPPLKEHLEEIVGIVCRAASDRYHEVKMAACKCAKQLAEAAHAKQEYMDFKAYAAKLSKSLFEILNHKHYEARVEAINALGHLALEVDASTDDLKNLIMHVSPMLMDLLPPVRRECGQMGILLMLKLRDRYSYFERIIPLVLCCLKDDCEDVRETIRRQWLTVGAQYYEENYKQLNEQEISELPIRNYPANVTRPSIGCRAIVQRTLRIVPTITREAKDWKDNVRLHAMKLLYQFVLHAESSMTALFFEILPDIARACCDSERDVINEALKVSDLLGRLLIYDEWIETAMAGLERANREGYLKCFYQMYAASLDTKLADDLRISHILVQPEYSHSLKLEIKTYAIKMVEKIMRNIFDLRQKEVGDSVSVGMQQLDLQGNREEMIENLQSNLYLIIVKVIAMSWDSRETEVLNLIAHNEVILGDLAKLQNLSVNKLHDKYLARAYDDVNNLDALLDANTEPILLLKGLIMFANLRHNALPVLQSKVQLVFEHCSGEAKINIFLAISAAMLKWHLTITLRPEESVELLRNFLADLVIPHLKWAPGAHAEAMRDMATATLAAVSESAVTEAQILLPEMASEFMPALLEDRSCPTRHYATRCLVNFGPIPMKFMKSIAYGVLQRLDDPSEEIRATACEALRKLRPKYSNIAEECEAEQDTWKSFIDKAFELLLIHYETPDKNLKKAIKKTIKQLATQNPHLDKNLLAPLEV